MCCDITGKSVYWGASRANFLSKAGQNWNIFKGFLSKVRQNSNSQIGNRTPLQEHTHTSMLALHCSDESQSLGQQYTFCISHFVSISRMFLRNTPQNTEHTLYTFRISCEFSVLLMLRKNKPQNSLTFCANANPGAKYEKNDAPYKALLDMYRV